MKVIGETHRHQSAESRQEVACPNCRKTTLVDGEVREVLIEDDDRAGVNPQS